MCLMKHARVFCSEDERLSCQTAAGPSCEQKLAPVQMSGLICYRRHAFHESAQLLCHLHCSTTPTSHTFRSPMVVTHPLKDVESRAAISRGDHSAVVQVDGRGASLQTWQPFFSLIGVEQPCWKGGLRKSWIATEHRSGLGPQPQLALGLWDSRTDRWLGTGHTHIHTLALVFHLYRPQH